jgi:hypothetical protein
MAYRATRFSCISAIFIETIRMKLKFAFMDITIYSRSTRNDTGAKIAVFKFRRNIFVVGFI